MKNTNWTYAGYIASFFGGNILTPLAGIATKGAQDTEIISPENKTADYIRMGALACATLDCILGAQNTFSSTQEFWETSADVITMYSLYTDLQAYTSITNPIRTTLRDTKDAIKSWYNSTKY